MESLEILSERLACVHQEMQKYEGLEGLMRRENKLKWNNNAKRVNQKFAQTELFTERVAADVTSLQSCAMLHSGKAWKTTHSYAILLQ